MGKITSAQCLIGYDNEGCTFNAGSCERGFMYDILVVPEWVEQKCSHLVSSSRALAAKHRTGEFVCALLHIYLAVAHRDWLISWFLIFLSLSNRERVVVLADWMYIAIAQVVSTVVVVGDHSNTFYLKRRSYGYLPFVRFYKVRSTCSQLASEHFMLLDY